jgi:nitrate reductase NapE component
MITNKSGTLRAMSTPKRAKRFVFIAILLWPLFASHIAIMTTIIN